MQKLISTYSRNYFTLLQILLSKSNIIICMASHQASRQTIACSFAIFLLLFRRKLSCVFGVEVGPELLFYAQTEIGVYDCLLQEIVGRIIGSKAGRLNFGWRVFFPGIFLVIDTEKGFAFFTTFLVLIDKFVQSIEIWRSGAVHIVPPITNEVLLIENCAIRTQKWVVIAIRLTHVKDLKKIKKGLFLFFYFFFFFGESWQHCLQINRICGLYSALNFI